LFLAVRAIPIKARVLVYQGPGRLTRPCPVRLRQQLRAAATVVHASAALADQLHVGVDIGIIPEGVLPAGDPAPEPGCLQGGQRLVHRVHAKSRVTGCQGAAHCLRTGVAGGVGLQVEDG